MEHALNVAARRWPSESRSKLLLRLVHEGGAALERGESEAVRRRREAVADTSGKYSGLFGPDFLSELRKDWPE